MNKIKGLFLATLAVAILFAGCKKKDDPEAPKISIITIDVNAFSIVKGDTVDFKFKAVAGDARIDVKPTVTYSLGTQAAVPASTLEAATIDNGYVITLNQILDSVGVYTFTLSVGDVDGLSDTAVVQVTVRNPDVLFTQEITDGVLWNAAGTIKGAWDLDSDTLVSTFDPTHAAIQNLDAAGNRFTGRFNAKNDTYYIGNESKTSETKIKIETSFVKVTADYSTFTMTQAETAYAAGAVLATVTPAVNDVYIAKKNITKVLVNGSERITSNESAIYLLKITAINDTADNGANDGKITFTYKK